MNIRHKGVISLLVTVLAVVLILSGCTAAGVRGIAQGWAGGVIAEGTIFVGSMEGKVLTLDAETGVQRGLPIVLESQTSSGTSFGCTPAGSSGVAIYSSPVFTSDMLFVGGYDGVVNAFPFEDGQLDINPRWVYPRSGSLGGPIIGGLVASGEYLYVASDDGSIRALNIVNGSEEWKFDAEGDMGKVWAAPAVADGIVYIGSFDKKLYALDAATGAFKWEFLTGGTISSTPVVINGSVYVGSFDRHIYAIDALTGQEKWRFPAEGQDGPEGWFWASPVVYNGVIYAPNLDGKVYAVDAVGGRSVNVYDLEQAISSSPVVVGDNIVVATSNTNRSKQQGNVYALTPGSNQTRLLYDMGETIFAPLFADDTTVYVQTMNNNLYAIDAGSGAGQKFSLSTE